MSTELVTSDQKWDQERIDLIKKTVAKELNDPELDLFAYQCKRTGLDPLTKQIYAQVRKNQRGDRSLIFITAIDGFRLIAARTGEHAGTDDAVFELNENDEPEKATVTVYRLKAGVRCGFTASARWSEYCPEPPADRMWRKMPHTMLAKCAEALALRKGFPNELSGIYSDSEMDQAGAAEQPPEPKVMPANQPQHSPIIEPKLTITVKKSHGDLGGYVLQAGKTKGEKIEKISLDALKDRVKWCELQMSGGSKLGHALKQDYEAMVAYIESLPEFMTDAPLMVEDIQV